MASAVARARHERRRDALAVGGMAAIPAAAVGGAALLTGESAGFATDFTYATDASRVALKSSGSTVAYAVDAFYANAGTSPKMVYDVAGTLGWSPHNICLQSQAFDNVNWTKENGTVTANAAVAPNGLLEADLFVENSATGPHDMQGGTLPATNGRVSVYAKTAGRPRFMLYDNASGAGGGFDITTGTTFAVSGLGTVSSQTMQDVGNGWWRCSMPTTALSSVSIYLCSGTSYTYAGDGVSGAYFWGAHLHKGDSLLAYLPTTIGSRVGLALDYDPATHAARGLLCEPQATNALTYSSDFANGGVWATVGVTVTANNALAPNGLMEADRLVFAGGGGQEQIYCAVTVAANNVRSVYLKGTAGQTITFSDNATSMLCTLTGGWDRFSLVIAAANGFFVIRIGTASTETARTVWAWGGQVETGTVATSPIPTLAATVTRAADQVSVTPASINYSATAGSWWAYVDIPSYRSQGRVIGNVSTGYTPIYVDTATVFSLFDGNIVSKTVPSVLGPHKVAAAFASADRALTADGLAPGTNTAAGTVLLSPGTAIGIGTDNNGANHCYVRQVRYLPRRPTNAELQTMTATVPYTGTIASQAMVTAAAASTGASASFTPPANSTLVAFVSARGGSSATATSLTDSLGSVWVKIGDYLGPNATAFVVTGVYTLAIGPSPVAMTVTGGSTVTGTSMGSGCQVISCTGSIGPLSNTQAGQSGVGSVSLTVSGVSVLTYYVRQTTASTIVIPTGYTELGGAHIQYNNMTASVAYDLTSPGNQNWTGGGNAIAWSGEISG